jgi:hypothetical protein
MSETLSSGLTLTIPTIGEQNWSTTIKTSCFSVISAHDHTGSGNGVQISTNAIATDAVTSAKIRLTNNSSLRARNAANNADVNILKLNASDQIEFGTNDLSWGTWSPTVSGNGTISISNTVANLAQYVRIGDLVIAQFDITFDISGAGNNLGITTPVTVLTTGQLPAFATSYSAGSSGTQSVQGQVNSSVNSLQVLTVSGNFPAETSNVVRGTVMYRAN